jgi:hypothetical protein
MKNYSDISGTEPATFRFLAQCLNQLMDKAQIIHRTVDTALLQFCVVALPDPQNAVTPTNSQQLTGCTAMQHKPVLHRGRWPRTATDKRPRAVASSTRDSNMAL